MVAVTTIKLEKTTKKALDTVKLSSETYDAAIRKLMYLVKQQNLKAELKEAYTQKARVDIELLEEWEPASMEVDNNE